ncbi:hypothetical protein M091_1471 [Parabacteroides distasonis str. 3776 D15 i]|uniref:Uncharacterized protein n=1 Tax=Parabacteroides distasonis str. 3776 D15 i TaxID=1339342 RepID=A0AB34LEC1_PARDI|nr:hypothetical protein M091_1471 [Parabacteroides distasonis str. 3776 D15 i]
MKIVFKTIRNVLMRKDVNLCKQYIMGDLDKERMRQNGNNI